jgi:DNA-binding NarL/FixJ family response regulator
MKILIVIDSLLIQIRLDITINYLSDNVKLIKAKSCTEALIQLMLPIPDLLIPDVFLPDVSGISILHQIKKHAPLLPVYRVTSFPTDELKYTCRRGGADAFFDTSNFHGLMESIDLLHNELLKMS